MSEKWKMYDCGDCAYLTLKVRPKEKNREFKSSELGLCKKFNIVNALYYFEKDNACPEFVQHPLSEEQEEHEKQKKIKKDTNN
jgi:hypothetical protein